ncbi:MAG TPA: hypothetical protein VGE39_21820 [Prosthecobacter sp.]
MIKDIMSIFRSKPLALFLALLLLIFAVIDFFPTYGPPFFRYTGSDPNHHVWNFGLPFAWTIYDKDTAPFWITSPPMVYGVIFLLQGSVVISCLLIPWLLRKK